MHILDSLDHIDLKINFGKKSITKINVNFALIDFKKSITFLLQ